MIIEKHYNSKGKLVKTVRKDEDEDGCGYGCLLIIVFFIICMLAH